MIPTRPDLLEEKRDSRGAKPKVSPSLATILVACAREEKIKFGSLSLSAVLGSRGSSASSFFSRGAVARQTRRYRGHG